MQIQDALSILCGSKTFSKIYNRLASHERTVLKLIKINFSLITAFQNSSCPHPTSSHYIVFFYKQKGKRNSYHPTPEQFYLTSLLLMQGKNIFDKVYILSCMLLRYSKMHEIILKCYENCTGSFLFSILTKLQFQFLLFQNKLLL